MLENLLAVGTLDLLFRSLVAVLAQTEDSVVILALPVLCVSLEHDRVFWLADLAIVCVLCLFCLFLCLNALVLGKGALVSLLRRG